MALIKKRQEQSRSRVIQPLVNIDETEREVILEAEMAGLAREDIGLELKGNELTIKGKTKESDGDIPKGYTVIHKERCLLEYLRTFILGDDIDSNKIAAQYENGILRVKLSKADKAQPKRIEIKE